MDEPTEKEATSPERRGFGPWHLLCGLLIAWAIWYVWPYLDQHPEQDECAYNGRVSNKTFSAMLDKAKSLAAQQWVPMTFWIPQDKEKALEADIKSELVQFLDGYQTLEEKILAVHAAMRARGAFFESSVRYVWIENNNVFTSSASYAYYFLSHKIDNTCIICLVYRWTVIKITFIANDEGEFSSISDLAIIGNNFLLPRKSPDPQQDCPPPPYGAPIKTWTDGPYRDLLQQNVQPSN